MYSTYYFRLAEVAKKKAAVEDAYWADEGDKNSKKKAVSVIYVCINCSSMYWADTVRRCT